MTSHADALKSLHTTLIDSRKGYEAALESADGRGMGALFQDMVALRARHATELTGHLTKLGETPDADGSFMATVHWAVINVRALITGLDESVLPGLIDGEERILSYYDEAIEAARNAPDERAVLIAQRQQVTDKIAGMKARSAKAA
ncbi:MAG: ferritin-like domain-containing protein [Hyphomicrobium sp.]